MGEGLLADRTCLVTGATSGIGLETAVGLARAGARVLIAGRSAERGARARDEIARRSAGGPVELLIADLAALSDVRKLAAEVLARCEALHVLVANAGVVNTRRRVTVDGFEETFAVNHLAHFLLANLLRERLERSAPARVVVVASEAHRFGRLDLGDLQFERAYRGLPLVSGMRVYGASKLANLLFAAELARRLEGTGVTVNSVHPGAVATRLGQNNGALGRALTRLLAPLFLTPAQGAATSLYAASAPELEATSGRYFVRSREARPSAAARDAAAARRLWDASAALVGLEAPGAGW
jgi:NAD(P)-dependent dehydrogenase (short-subunit alcohol dehydrogenase family)